MLYPTEQVPHKTQQRRTLQFCCAIFATILLFFLRTFSPQFFCLFVFFPFTSTTQLVVSDSELPCSFCQVWLLVWHQLLGNATARSTYLDSFWCGWRARTITPKSIRNYYVFGFSCSDSIRISEHCRAFFCFNFFDFFLRGTQNCCSTHVLLFGGSKNDTILRVKLNLVYTRPVL